MLATSFSIKLDTSKNSKSKNGDYPVVLQVTHNRKPRRIRLGINATKESWVDGRVSDTLHNHKRINSRLSLFEDKALSIYEDHFEPRNRFDFKEFRTKFLEEDKTTDFYAVCDEFIQSKKKLKTRKFYKDCIQSLKKVHPTLSTKQLTPHLLLDHEKRYYSSAYMRGIRAVVNYAVMSEYISADSNPFKTSYNPTGYSFSHIKQKRKPVALSEIEIEQYKSLGDDTFYNDMAMFSYYTFGTNMWDFLQFSDENEVCGAIEFYRSKTSVRVTVPITPEARRIMEKYRKGNRWFPFCDFTDEEKARRRCDNLLRRVGKKIKSNCKKLEIKKEVSFYTMRHTSATIALKRGAPVEKISALLGHSDISTTQAYLDQFEAKELQSTIALL